jgi:hypothetical protein
VHSRLRYLNGSDIYVVSSLAIAPQNTTTIYAGTAEMWTCFPSGVKRLGVTIYGQVTRDGQRSPAGKIGLLNICVSVAVLLRPRWVILEQVHDLLTGSPFPRIQGRV